MHRSVTILGVLAAGLMLAATPALAARPSSSITLVQLSESTSLAATSSTSNPQYGDQVTFEVKTDRTEHPWVRTQCWQGGELVYVQWHGFFADYSYDPIFMLGPTQLWTGASATCTADLGSFAKNGSFRTLASTSFSVSG